MFSRRRFLAASGAGLAALSANCFPPRFQVPVHASEITTKKSDLVSMKDHMLGYPVNMNTPPEGFFEWRKELARAGIDVFAFNNVGNPFKASPLPYNTHDYECETIRTFGELYGFAPDNTWGFISHSGTDSNMHGMYMGKTLLKGRTGIAPKAYFTREAHYSVQILRDLLGLDAITVDTLADGGMDADDLAVKLTDNADFPALVVPTVGTTFKGAIDNLDQIQEKLKGHASYVHLDAALFGGYLPFTEHRKVVAHQTDEHGDATRYDSIAVSCHKFFGFPSPAGIFVTEKTLYDEFNELFSQIHNPEYIHHVPGTITCSRDAVKPAEFNFFTTPAAQDRQVEDAQLMLQNTGYLLDELQRHFPELAAVRINPLSNTVFFKCPNDTIVEKYSLATMHLEKAGTSESEEFAHVVVMPHVSVKVIDEFLTDLSMA